MKRSEAYQSAKKRIEAKMGFYTHLSVYVAVILFLAVINFVTSAGTIWFQWPMSSLGIAVFLHSAFDFVFPGRFTVTEKAIEKETGMSWARH
ncbi:MAG: 2TM domain-containing protein [Paracoccaceae bacterium]